MSKTNRDRRDGNLDRPAKRKPHPKRYTDPIEDVDKYIIEELEGDDNS